jgi:hypothetical protein
VSRQGQQCNLPIPFGARETAAVRDTTCLIDATLFFCFATNGRALPGRQTLVGFGERVLVLATTGTDGDPFGQAFA